MVGRRRRTTPETVRSPVSPDRWLVHVRRAVHLHMQEIHCPSDIDKPLVASRMLHSVPYAGSVPCRFQPSRGLMQLKSSIRVLVRPM
jgi:hypothetical protein